MASWFLIVSKPKYAPQFHQDNNSTDDVTYYAYASSADVAKEYISKFKNKKHMYYREVTETLIDKLESQFDALEEVMYIKAEYCEEDEDNGRCEIVCTPEEYSNLCESLDGYDTANEHGATFNMERYANFYKGVESKCLLEALQKFKDMLQDSEKVAKYRKKSWYYSTMQDFGLR